jgi:hypothetical protein
LENDNYKWGRVLLFLRNQQKPQSQSLNVTRCKLLCNVRNVNARDESPREKAGKSAES